MKNKAKSKTYKGWIRVFDGYHEIREIFKTKKEASRFGYVVFGSRYEVKRVLITVKG